MDPDLLRQRRNLIAISVILLLFDFAEVRIGKINVLGTELLVGDPQVLMTFAWLMWAYFFVRYYQYWRRCKAPVRATYKDQMAVQQSRFEDANGHIRQDAMGMTVEGRLQKTSPFRREIVYEVPQYDPAHGRVSVEISAVPVHFGEFLRWRIRSVVHTALHSHVVTDHVLPFALAFAAPVVTVLH